MSLFNRFISIRIKIVLAVGIGMSIILSTMLIFAIHHIQTDIKIDLQFYAKSLGYQASQTISSEINTAFQFVEDIAKIIQSQSSSDIIYSRESIIQMLHSILSNHLSFQALFTIWEPNAFDGNDQAYLSKNGCTLSGRFAPYWFRGENGQLMLKPATGFDSISKGSYYTIPMRTLRPLLIDIHDNPNQINEDQGISIIVPLVHANTFLGIVGIDLSSIFFTHSLKKTIRESFSIDHCKEFQSPMLYVITHSGLIFTSTDPNMQMGTSIDQFYSDHPDMIPDFKQRTDCVRTVNNHWIEAIIPVQLKQLNTQWSIISRMSLNHINSHKYEDVINFIVLDLILSGFILLVLVLIIQYLLNPLSSLSKKAEKIAQGQIQLDQLYESNDEIGQVAKSFNAMITSLKEITLMCEAIAIGDFSHSIHVRSENDRLGKSVNIMGDMLREIAQQAETIAKGDYSGHIVLKSSDDSLGKALNAMIESLRELSEINKKKEWMIEGQNKLYNAMRGNPDRLLLAEIIVTQISKYLNAQVGALYCVFQEDTKIFKLTGTYAFSPDTNQATQFRIGEGLIGQTAFDKRMIIYQHVPNNHIPILSGTGMSEPLTIIAFPFIYNDEVLAVIELGAFSDFSENQIEFIERVAESVAVALDSSNSRQKMLDLLNQTEMQRNELQAQQEELKAVNEELEEKSRSLQQSEMLLKTQQEELQVSNEELEEKNKELEKRAREIQSKNLALQNTQKQLEKKSTELEQSSRYKSEFLANMSHELRTPLNSLLILSQSLIKNKDGSLKESHIDALTVIHKSGKDLLDLINDILDLSKIEAGKMSINIEQVPLARLKDNIYNHFKHIVQQKQLFLRIKADGKLPEMIYTDQQRLEQIIKNLLSNAIKFTEQGGITIEFKPPDATYPFENDQLKNDNTVEIAVTDTGIGIPEDKLKAVFEEFKQVHDISTQKKYGGTGLGLSISSKLAKLLGGEIHVSSEYGKGSTFAVIVPFSHQLSDIDTDTDTNNVNDLAINHSIEKPEIESFKELEPISWEFNQTMQVHMPDPPLKKSAKKCERIIEKKECKTILIIEDDPNFLDLLKMQCIERGFNVLNAVTGEEGINIARKQLPDGIILDLFLPGIDGWKVLDDIKKHEKTRHIPVHIVSAIDETIDSFSRGAIGYLMKPLNMDQIKSILNRIEGFISRRIKTLLIVEDETNMRNHLKEILAREDLIIAETTSGKETISILITQQFDCMILDLGLNDMTGFELLKKLESQQIEIPPVIVYTAKELTKQETEELNKFTDTIIMKGIKSEERLLDETAIFLSQAVGQNDSLKQRPQDSEYHLFMDKVVLVVDDDMRNVFAVTRVMGERGMIVLKAENGQKAIERLENEKRIDIILMDIMMPVMDGYEAIQTIRKLKNPKLRKVPIIALTAKAMKEDRDKCMKAGASDYMTKPVDIDRLFSLMKIWLDK